MNYPSYSFYDPVTGLFTGKTFTGSVEAMLLNIPAGTIAIPGTFDPQSQCVDISTGRVMDYQPPSPGDDYEWDPAAKRWVLGSAAQQAVDADVAARAQLAAIDLASIRALREAAIGNPDALGKLVTLDAEAAPLRADVIKTDQEEAATTFDSIVDP